MFFILHAKIRNRFQTCHECEWQQMNKRRKNQTNSPYRNRVKEMGKHIYKKPVIKSNCRFVSLEKDLCCHNKLLLVFQWSRTFKCPNYNQWIESEFEKIDHLPENWTPHFNHWHLNRKRHIDGFVHFEWYIYNLYTKHSNLRVLTNKCKLKRCALTTEWWDKLLNCMEWWMHI